MGLRGPSGLPKEQREILWSQWKSGHRMREIARGLGIDHGCVRTILLVHGGFTPAARHRALRVLTLGEREIISRGIAADESTRAIARRLNRSASTISLSLIHI